MKIKGNSVKRVKRPAPRGKRLQAGEAGQAEPVLSAEVTADTGARPRLPWTDFHLVLAVSREGSVAKACVTLGMTHSTLLRKLDQIEHRLKTRLFDRVRGRYTLTPAGQEIEQAARSFEPVASAAESRAMGQDLRPSGEVRVSVSSVVLQYLMPPVLAQFAPAFPEVQIEMSTSREHVSLRRREADIAIRVADAVPDWLVGRRLVDLDFKIFGRRRSGGSRLPMRSVEELASERRWVGFESDARELKFDRWLAGTVPESSVVLRVDNFSHALTMVRAGLGVGLLPAFLAASFDDIQALTPAITELQTPLWLITHPELRNAMRIKVFMQAFGPALAQAAAAAQSARGDSGAIDA
jgi:DNA-binding transcriptional LysR family regulator